MQIVGEEGELLEIHVKVSRMELDEIISDLDGGAWYETSRDFLKYLRGL